MNQMYEKWKSMGITYKGEPFNIGGEPEIISKETIAKIEKFGQEMHRVLEQVDALYQKDDKFQKIFGKGLNDFEKEVSLIPTKGHPAPLMRVDAHIAENGAIKILEANTSLVDGFEVTEGLYRLFSNSWAAKIDIFNPVSRLKNFFGENNKIAIVYNETTADFTEAARAFNKFGLESKIVSITRFNPNEFDCAFLYFKPNELKNYPEIIEKYRDGYRIVPPLKRHLENKNILSLLHNPGITSIFKNIDLNFLKTVVPFTISWDKLKIATNERKNWVLKPTLGDMCRDIFIGKACSAKQWNLATNQTKKPYVLQEYIPAPETTSGKTKSNLFFINGKFVGGFATKAKNRLIINDSGANTPIIGKE